MRKLITLLLLISISAASQAQAPKKALKIITVNQQDQKTNFKNALNVLIDNGYMIAKSDSATGTILTEDIPATKEYLTHRIYIIARDNKITISGQAKAGYDITLYGVTTKAEWFPIENKGMKGSPSLKAFSRIENIASKLPGTKTYE